MYCTQCGTHNPDGVAVCSSCGNAMPNFPAQIPNYLAQSILVTICCCVPFGIPAIVYASQVNTKLQAGDVAGAQEASGKAKMWSWIAFGLGLAGGLAYFALAILGVLAEST